MKCFDLVMQRLVYISANRSYCGGLPGEKNWFAKLSIANETQRTHLSYTTTHNSKIKRKLACNKLAILNPKHVIGAYLLYKHDVSTVATKEPNLTLRTTSMTWYTRRIRSYKDSFFCTCPIMSSTKRNFNHLLHLLLPRKRSEHY